ncbi:MAG: B12-binding domain-containing radical SAM protein [Deltaproteobacteria bacterium]|nr:B12-binding domain-containing radical SAM protein [Deltaproteobacteria bacterium]
MLRKKAILPPLGLLTLAALLPREWDLKLIDLIFQKISPKDWEDCDLVLVSGMAVQYRGILETIREGKRRGKTIVAGGPWVFHFPQEALAAGADLVVKGEGETTISLLLESLSRQESGRVISAPGFANLQDSPPPRYDLIDLNDYVDMAVQFSRGCPFNCEFCDIKLMLGPRFRTKRPGQILTELQNLYDLGWRGSVFLVDDNFIGHPGKAKALLREMLPWLESRGRPFQLYTQASVNLAAEPELLELMVQSGFTCVFLGIETPDTVSLQQTGKVQNVAVDLDQVCREINRAGLIIQAGCIIGFDGEKAGADQRLLDFARRTQVPEMFVTLLQAGPGTAMWKRLEKEGRLLPLNPEHLSNQTGLLNFVPTRPLEQIVEEFVNLYETLYAPGNYLERVFGFLERMRPPVFPVPFSLPHLYELRAVLIVFFRQGWLYDSRRQFWRYFFKVLRQFPARMPNFITLLIKGEHYFDFRQTIAQELRRQMVQIDQGSAQPLNGDIERNTAPKAS